MKAAIAGIMTTVVLALLLVLIVWEHDKRIDQFDALGKILIKQAEWITKLQDQAAKQEAVLQGLLKWDTDALEVIKELDLRVDLLKTSQRLVTSSPTNY